jgi:hypothetical protein
MQDVEFKSYPQRTPNKQGGNHEILGKAKPTVGHNLPQLIEIGLSDPACLTIDYAPGSPYAPPMNPSTNPSMNPQLLNNELPKPP